jgi:hypothetical protein
MHPLAANLSALCSVWAQVAQSWSAASDKWTDDVGTKSSTFFAMLESRTTGTLNALERLSAEAAALWDELMAQEQSL